MSAALALLAARRAAPPAAWVLVGLAALLPLVGGPPGTLAHLPPDLAQDSGAARTAWLAALAVAAALGVAAGARLCQRWFDGESAWMAPSAPARIALVAPSVLGTAWGAAGVLLVAAAAIGALRPRGEETPLELVGVAGPERSVVLAPGESYRHALAAPVAPDVRARVRLLPTFGAPAPVTRARLGVEGGGAADLAVVRRTWGEFEAGEGPQQRFDVTNVGEGAMAVLGPRPLELWAPSRAALGGHLRVLGFGALLVSALAALAAAAGAWMTPAVAGMLAGAVGLAGAAGAGIAVPLLSTLTAGLGRALDAVDEGRVPAAPAAAELGAAALAWGAAVAVILPALGRWHREGRR